MKKCNKCHNNQIDALKLALIITGSIVAAAGIILVLWKLLKKKKAKKAVCEEPDGVEEISDLSWENEDFSELEVDDAACDQCENSDCTACQVNTNESDQ